MRMDHVTSKVRTAIVVSREGIRLNVEENVPRRFQTWKEKITSALIGESCFIESRCPPHEYD